MTRTRASAKSAGTAFETLIAGHLAETVDDRIERRVRTGGRDRGDIAGVRINGHRLVIECKNHARLDLPGWIAEAQVEADNDGAIAGIVVHKRRGTQDPCRQFVTMTVAELVAILNAAQEDRPDAPRNGLRGHAETQPRGGGYRPVRHDVSTRLEGQR